MSNVSCVQHSLFLHRVQKMQHTSLLSGCRQLILNDDGSVPSSMLMNQAKLIWCSLTMLTLSEDNSVICKALGIDLVLLGSRTQQLLLQQCFASFGCSFDTLISLSCCHFLGTLSHDKSASEYLLIPALLTAVDINYINSFDKQIEERASLPVQSKSAYQALKGCLHHF